jgi:hypothetical protein
MRLALIVALALTGCATVNTEPFYSDHEMMTTAVALTKVSAAVEANLRYGAPSEDLTDAEFLTRSVAHDPTLLKPFSEYRILATRQGNHAAMLVCSPDGTTALLEDAGCTAPMDLLRWQEHPRKPCAFSIDLAKLCPRGRD